MEVRGGKFGTVLGLLGCFFGVFVASQTLSIAVTVKAVFWPLTVTASDQAREATRTPKKRRWHDSGPIFAPLAPPVGALWGVFWRARGCDAAQGVWLSV